MKITRENDDGNRFDVLADGKAVFYAERELYSVKGELLRGNWILYMPTQGCGLLQVDRDQYSNDLMERCEIHLNERPVYGKRFKAPMTREEFDLHVREDIAQLEKQFGGSFFAEYDSYEGKAIFEKQ